ncbi:MAG: hypothetical protein R3267_12210 [Paenisporosarcina sp.]|nr:hypothetical protein [Paenisporosarcina sp.]
MIWYMILIPVGLIAFGILYDLFKNKSFKEMKAPSKSNKSAENAIRDANTNKNVNSSGPF